MQENLYVSDLESLEAISQDELARRVVLKLAAIRRAGRLEPFLAQLAADSDVDDETKEKLAELGRDEGLLLAVEDYLCSARTACTERRYNFVPARGRLAQLVRAPL